MVRKGGGLFRRGIVHMLHNEVSVLGVDSVVRFAKGRSVPKGGLLYITLYLHLFYTVYYTVCSVTLYINLLHFTLYITLYFTLYIKLLHLTLYIKAQNRGAE